VLPPEAGVRMLGSGDTRGARRLILQVQYDNMDLNAVHHQYIHVAVFAGLSC